MYKKRIFIGSSSKQKENVKKIACVLEEIGCDVTRWWDSSVFRVGEYTFDSLLQAAHLYDAGLFLLAEDDYLYNDKGEDFKTTRDNVLLEAGVFFGALGRNGVGLCVVGSPKMPTDWAGITTIKFNHEENRHRFQDEVERWLKKVKHRNNEKPFNVHMQARKEIDQQYLLKKRLNSDSDVYMHIRSVKILNLASNLFINPDDADSECKSDDTLHLSKVMYLIIKNNSNARIQLVLAEPTYNVLKDVNTKIANPIGATEVIYSTQSKLYEFLTSDEVFKAAYRENRFLYKVTDLCLPFAIFAVEYDSEFSFLNHVRVDLYSAALTNENDRRSMVIWQNQDHENYQFFRQNFENIRQHLSRRPSMDEMKIWSEKWENELKNQ